MGRPSQPALKAGQKFGSLTILYYAGRKMGYFCKCDCGNTTRARGWALKNGKHTHCSCGQTLPRKRKPDHIAAKNEVYKNYRQAANRRKHNFSLTKIQFNSIISKDCSYCGSSPSLLSSLKAHPDFRYNGIDRIDNKKGYIIDNCVPCCKTCNYAKHELSHSEFMKWNGSRN